MRRFDKLKNIKKANLLAEQRYKVKLNESTDVDLMNIIIRNIDKFSMEDDYLNNNSYYIKLYYDRFEGIVFNGINIEDIELTVKGKYDVTSYGYYSPGKSYGPPEDSYPDESENPEFDITIEALEVATTREVDGTTGLDEIIELSGPNVQKLPKEFLGFLEGKVEEMLLDSGKFDPSDRNDDYDGYDRDDYDPSDTEAREWGGMDI